jgi:serine/threonine protein kinase
MVGLHELHKAGICHLDVKSENILMDKNLYCIKICDFGMSTCAPAIKTTDGCLFCQTNDSGLIVKKNNREVGTDAFNPPELF